MPKLRVKVPKNDGEYLDAATELQAAYNASQKEFKQELRLCHNVIADMAHALMKQETMLDAHVQTLALIQKSGILTRSSATCDHLPTLQRTLSAKSVNHYRQAIQKDLEEGRWDQATFIGSIVDVANWRGSKSIQYHEQNKGKDFVTEARKDYGHIAVDSGALWRPEEIRDDDAPNPLEFYQNMQSVATGFYTPPPQQFNGDEEEEEP